jgi:hypothetical protein
MSKKKSVDGFVPSKKNAGTYFKSSKNGGEKVRNGRGIPANELLDDEPIDDQFVKDIVPLPTPNGNDLRIKGYEDFVKARGAKKAQPAHTIEDFLDDASGDDEGDLSRPISRTRGGLLPDYEQDDVGVDDDADTGDELADMAEEIEEKPASKRSKLLFWQKDDEDDEEPDEDEDIDEELEDEPTDEDDDFDIYNERSRKGSSRKDKTREVRAERRAVEEFDDEDSDNDLGVDDEDIARYRSRRFKREKKDSFRDESNVVLRVIGGAVIVVVTICVTYFMFTLFYNAPEPAKIDNNVVETTTKSEENKKPEEKPVEVAETPATIAVYNATTTAGLAKSLADKLVAAGKDAVIGTTNNGNAALTGSGYAILDFTGGKKPKNLDELKGLLGGTVEVISDFTVANLPANVQTDRDFVVIIR